MKKEDLKQIRQLKAEFDDLERTIESMGVSTTVRASDKNFPYLSRTVSVSGISPYDEKKIRKLQRQKNKIKRKYSRLLRYIYGIEDNFIKKIFIYRYEQGQSWIKIQQRLGVSSADQVRKVHDRYLKKH